MAAVENGTGGLPTNPQGVAKVFVAGVGEDRELRWRGSKASVEAKYAALKTDLNLSQAEVRTENGRAEVVARYSAQGDGIAYPTDITIVEELYAIDVVRDVWNAPLFTTGGAYALSEDQVAWIRNCVEQRWTESEITENGEDSAGKSVWASWTAGMKELRYQMLHGMESYYDTAFVFRRSLTGVRSSAMNLSFTNINRKVDAPNPVTAISSIFSALPPGEWLYRCPQVESLKRGRVRGTLEWQWANQLSVVYGGSLGLAAAP